MSGYMAHLTTANQKLGYLIGPDRETVERELGSTVYFQRLHLNADGRHGYYAVSPKPRSHTRA